MRIEGLTGVGKTTLARALADRISAVVFHGDDLIERRKTGEPYRDVVRFDQLQAAITNALSCGAMVVIESACLDEIAPATINWPRLPGLHQAAARSTIRLHHSGMGSTITLMPRPRSRNARCISTTRLAAPMRRPIS